MHRRFMWSLTYFILILIFKEVENYVHLKILKGGGYTGLFCLEPENIKDKTFLCIKQQSSCHGMGKMEYKDDKVPLNFNYYNGTIHECKINDCNFNSTIKTIEGSESLNYIFLYEQLSVVNKSDIVKNGETYAAYINNINLVAVSNVNLKFDNPLFSYTNLSINQNKLKCNLQVNDDKVYNTKFISKITLLYGNNECRKSISLGYVFLHKDPFNIENYIQNITKQNNKELNKVHAENIKELKNKLNEIEKMNELKIKNITRKHDVELYKVIKEYQIKLNSTDKERLVLKENIQVKSSSFNGIITLLVIIIIVLIIVILILAWKYKEKTKSYHMKPECGATEKENVCDGSLIPEKEKKANGYIKQFSEKEVENTSSYYVAVL